MTSNDITIHLDALSDADEAATAAGLRRLIAATPDGDYQRQDALCRSLGYLPGDAAARVKADLYIHGRFSLATNCRSTLSQGFFSSRHPEMVVEAFEAAMADVSQPVDMGTVISASVLKGWMRTLARTPGTPPDPATIRGAWPGRYDISRDEYLAALTASLSSRSGVSRARTAATIMLTNSWVPPTDPGAVRAAVVEGFDLLTDEDQEDLIRFHWREIRDPSLAAPLQRLIARRDPIDDDLRALAEIAPDQARPIILAEILAETPRFGIGPLITLPDDTLPEIEGPLLAQLRALAVSDDRYRDLRGAEKARLLARYATASVRDQILSFYGGPVGRLGSEVQAALLVYLIKQDAAHDPFFAHEVEKAADASDLMHQVVVAADGHSRAAVVRAVRPIVASDDPKVSASAVRALQALGSSNDSNVLRARLDRWLATWRPRASDLERDARLTDQVQLEVALLVALRSWAVSPEEKTTLGDLCLTSSCRRQLGVK